ncbi:MAG TPA: metalloregulator ArsR/SmtB family transcription factor [Phycisphaerae bacterium]|jgi:DNA-binding transcriptional ArsR family regulator
MARAATTSDVFNAIAEPRRRELIGVLSRGRSGVGVGRSEREEKEDGGLEFEVGYLVEEMKMPQPSVSKHLGVLRKVGIVSVSRRGRQRLYRLNARKLKPVHDWITMFEKFWTHQVDRIKERAERKARELAAGQNVAAGKDDSKSE